MNIGEIARRAGVSRSTVSYAFSGKRAVSEETRRRIQAVIDELDYRPNAAARALKEGRTRTIGLVIPPASLRLTDMQLGFVASVVEAAARADLDVLLSPSGGDHDRSFERVVSGRRVDGVILMEIRLEDERVIRLQKTGLPFVTIGHTARPQRHLLDRPGLRQPDRPLRATPRRPRAPPAGPDQPLDRAGRRRLRARPARRWPASPRPSTVAVSPASISAAVTTPPPARPASSNYCDEHPGVDRHRHHQRGRPAGHRTRRSNGRALPFRETCRSPASSPAHWAEDFRPPLTAADVPTEMGTHAVDLLLERIATPGAPPTARAAHPADLAARQHRSGAQPVGPPVGDLRSNRFDVRGKGLISRDRCGERGNQHTRPHNRVRPVLSADADIREMTSGRGWACGYAYRLRYPPGWAGRGPARRSPHRAPAHTGQGAMFWLRWNRLSGSYLRFTSTRRS